MKYMGSKARFAKYILPLVLENRVKDQWYVEPFCGGCNLIDKVKGNRLANDINVFLVEMWKAIQNGWNPPKSISKKEYDFARNCYNKKEYNLPLYEIGYIGFNGSYGGRFFDGGYAGISNTKLGTSRNYPLEAYNNIVSQISAIQEVKFSSGSYSDLLIPDNSIIYCDPPYKSTKKYSTGLFDHDLFFNWCRNMASQGHRVFVSEYEAPIDFACILTMNAKSSLSANGIIGGNKVSTEKLFTIN